MTINYYTLFHLAAELNRDFSGRIIDQIFSQHHDELIISFREMPAVIITGCDPSNNYLYARNVFARANRNSVNLFTAATESVVDKIYIHSSDRQIHIHLKSNYQFVLQFYGPKANVLLLDNIGNIVELFLKKSDTTDAQAKSISNVKYSELPDLSPGAIFTACKTQTLKSALKQVFPQFGTVLAEELITRTGLNNKETVDDLSENERVDLLKNAKHLIEELLSQPTPRIYYDGDTPVLFSIIPLQHLKDLKCQSFNSVSEGVQTYRSSILHEKEFLREKEEIAKVLKHKHDDSERTLKKISAEIESQNQMKQYDKYGKLLMAQLHLVKKGDASAFVEDYIDDAGNIIEIPLDPNLTPAKNAERYFKKAEKSHHTFEELSKRIIELTQLQKSAFQLKTNLEEVASPNQLKNYIEENKDQLAQFGLKTKKPGIIKKEEPSPFRVFIVAGGFQVWAGKSSENNDLLSTRHTAKNDLWFHARGVGGSHVVLKIGTGKGEVSRQAIEETASIAAYYSKMRKSKLVPVTMCEGKYVRKPKGAPAGTVIVEREKTIFAEPALPASS